MITFLSITYLTNKFNLGSFLRPKSKQVALTVSVVSMLSVMVLISVSPAYITIKGYLIFMILSFFVLGYLYFSSLAHLYKNCSI